MITKRRILICVMILLAGILFVDLASAYLDFSGSSRNSYTSTYYGSNYNFNRYYASEGRLQSYWPQLTDKDSCEARQDILIQVSPAGCQPTVVRSDLLEEQNVAVFCQLDSLKLNPLIDVKQIRNIRFKGDYPEEVVGVGFHPAKAALRTRNQLLGSPVLNNIGYVVVVLKKQESEKDMPDFVNFTLTASLDYYSGNALGTGKTEFLLKEVSDEKDWEFEKLKQSFFNGKYSLRLLDSTPEYANIVIYSGDKKVSTLKIDKGKSKDVYLPGSYCRTALKVNYDGLISSPSIKAKLQIDDDTIEVWKGSNFLNGERNGKCTVLDIRKDNNTNSKVTLRCGGKKFDLSIKVRGGDIGVEELIDITRINDEYFDSSELHSLDLLKQFPYEKQQGAADLEGSDIFAERSLVKEIKLANKYGKQKTEAELIGKYLEVYPNGEYVETQKTNLAKLLEIDYSEAGRVVNIDNSFKFIRLIDVEKPDEKSSAKISWGGKTLEINEGESTIFEGIGKLSVDRVYSAEKINVRAECSIRKTDGTLGYENGQSFTLRFDREKAVEYCGKFFRLQNIGLKQVAKVRVSSVVRTSGETNFTIGIGIEKRAFKLNPEKSREKIDNLNKTIAKWESISNNLGKVVKGLKGACFATAGILMVKNFFAGASGEALARQQVMGGDGGWTKYCENEKTKGTYVSLTQCYNDKRSEIKKDVDVRAKAIAQTNQILEGIEDGAIVSTGGFFGGDSIDTGKAASSLTTKLLEDYGDETIKIGNEIKKVSEFVNEKSYENNEAGYQELRDLYMNLRVRKNGGFSRGNISENELMRIGESIAAKSTLNGELQRLNSNSNIPNAIVLSVDGQNNIQTEVKESPSNWGSLGTSHAATVVTNKGSYALGLKQTNKPGVYTIDKVVKINDDNSLGDERDKDEFIEHYKLGSVESISASSYNNRFASGEAVVKYYETEPYKGMPALVPIDEEQGWYVATKQTIPGLGNIKAFESNGRPSSFWLCNVMNDGRVGFSSAGFGGDKCAQFNLNTGQPLDQFPGLQPQETKKWVNKAISALTEAARQYGKKTGESVNILGKAFKVGGAAAYLPGTQCQDYMSPEDCRILFNVCDPVICPASRCNLGGAYPVADVIQTGIVGSALLCLPNWNDGVMMPVCLTGIQAGIDGYLSILKQHQACLQENIDTGKTVGICDMITSVYTCEFFWRQAAPIANIILPKVIEYAYSGGARTKGGGEYLSVQTAWDNAQGSVDYFTQSYAVNSFEAFKIRSVEEAGSEVCRAWISLKGPKSFDTLLEPDSPTQFHAWFSSIPFSDATVPATSQYKVFYHIFAGKDAGASYSVYLKDPPESTYRSAPTIVASTGFVPKGEAASETLDFTAPAGYKQLCVRINNEEKCGFKQVSTSFAVNYVRDEIIKDELTRENIVSEKACVSGSLNAAALLNPNLQEAAQEAIDPAIYNRGIVRICSTDNPGSRNDPTRFVNMGYCDDPAVGCWLDKRSVDKSLTTANIGARNGTMNTLEEIRSGQEVLSDVENLVAGDLVNKKYEELNSEADKIISNGDLSSISVLMNKFNEAISWATFNHDKAWFMFAKAEFYRNLFDKLEKGKDAIEGDKPTESGDDHHGDNPDDHHTSGTGHVDGDEHNVEAHAENHHADNHEDHHEDHHEDDETNEASATEPATQEVLMYLVIEDNGKKFVYLGATKTRIYENDSKLYLEGLEDEEEVGLITSAEQSVFLRNAKIDDLKQRDLIDELEMAIFNDLNGKNFEEIRQGIIEVPEDVSEFLEMS